MEELEAMSEDYSKGIHRVGDESAFMPGGFEVAALAAGGAITATEAVLEGKVENAYVLCRWVCGHGHMHMAICACMPKVQAGVVLRARARGEAVLQLLPWLQMGYSITAPLPMGCLYVRQP